MTIDDIQIYAIPALFIGYIVWSNMKYTKVKKQIPELLKQGAQIIDVRTRDEFRSSSNKNSINIPLSEVQNSLNKIKRDKTVIVVCRSGNRSGMAAKILKQNGFTEVINAGPWQNSLVE